MFYSLFLFGCGLIGYTIGWRIGYGEWWWENFKKDKKK